MARLTIADLVANRVVLAPREATALTLAIARALDRYRATCGPASLPDDAAIVLHRSGDVSFLAVPRPSRRSEAAALCALLARLLGADRPAESGELLQNRMSAYAFRAALARVADDDPVVLAAVFWRAASALRRRAARRAAASRNRPRAERRRQQPSAAELRRSIRTLEEQLFDARQTLARIAPRQRRTHRIAAAGWVALSGALVLLAMMLFGQESRATTVAEDAAALSAPVQVQPPAPHPAQTSRRIAPAAPGSAPRGARQQAPLRRAAGSRGTRVRDTTRPHEPRRPVFVGGTRSIGWTTSSR